LFQFGLPPLRRQEPVEAAVTTWSWITAFPHDFDSNSGIIGQKSHLIRWRAPVGSLEAVIILARPWSAAMLSAYETKVYLVLPAYEISGLLLTDGDKVLFIIQLIPPVRNICPFYLS
jgi:hypothetical protein